MNLSKIGDRLRSKARNLKQKIWPGTLILMYHRVAEVDIDPWSLCVTPKNFASHLEVLREYGYPIKLQQLTKTLCDRDSIKRSVVITFDDGYADNLFNAKPLLEKYDIPATFFITTGGIDNPSEFWWDELEKILLQPGTLPDLLELEINGSNYQWELGSAADYTHRESQRDRSWKALEEEPNPTQRHHLYNSLYQLLHPLPAQQQQQVLQQLRQSANLEPLARSTHRSLTRSELFSLETPGLLEIGAHAVTHPFLTKLSLASQQQEIQQSKDDLEQILGHPITSFSFPNGDYKTETISLVKQAGFSCACNSVVAKVRQHSNCFELPRVVVENWDGETFARWLSTWL
jgi:peptidoglycan/xylan/chitin deacetylase (PgdA/CDA1 family)